MIRDRKPGDPPFDNASYIDFLLTTQNRMSRRPLDWRRASSERRATKAVICREHDPDTRAHIVYTVQHTASYMK